VKAKQPLRQRIVIAFVLMTLLISAGFSIGIVQIVYLVEEHLVTEEMHSRLQAAMDALGTGRAPALDSDQQLFTDSTPQLLPPLEFARVGKGFSEVVSGEQAFYAYKINRDGFAYILVEDQQEFEAREQLLFDGVLIGFVASLLIAWILGELVAKRVMQPVVSLADEVRTGSTAGGKERLAKDYADDEVGRLAAAFDDTLEQLGRSLEREKLFIGDVSHELRTPLMVIGTSCELLAGSHGLDAKQRAQLERIRRASEDMLELVKTLLLLARERSDNDGGHSLVSLAAAVGEQNAIWSAQFTARGIDYRCVVESPDPGQYQSTFLRTVISNLLRNALHYTDQGGVRLVLYRGGFRVEDTGPGIAPEQYAHVFRPFQRGSHARGEGLGLGLSLVKRICEHQGWGIRVLPGEPRGCVFQVDFSAK